MKIELKLTFTKEEVEEIREGGCCAVDCYNKFSCELCPFSNMESIADKYHYALEHMEQ